MLTRNGPLHIGQGKYKRDWQPIDPDAPWSGTALGEGPSVSRAYLHHLRVMREPLYDTLASMHNLRHMLGLMAELRAKILNDDI